MQRAILLFPFLLLLNPSGWAQSADSCNYYYSSHSITGGMGMESMAYVQYKYKFFNSPHLQSNTLSGLGYTPGDTEGGIPTHLNIAMGISQSVAIRPVFLSVGIVPILHFYDHVTYLNLNGLIGLKYEPKMHDGMTFEIGYLPLLYNTHKNNVGLPFYLGFGASL